MEAIFHEKQEGSLCAQHCLNNLLQGEYFSPIDLSTIAQQLDEEERARMAEGGTTTEEYKIFLQQPSGNMDDSGFFSIQVISSALRVWGLEITLFNSPEYQRLRIDPIIERAFICNYKEHWFTVRKLGNQWFNLNSLLTGPELISDTYLALFLAQLQQEGYSIFVVRGDLPECAADDLLKRMRVVQLERPKLIGEEANQQTETEQRVQSNDWEQVIDVNKSISNDLDDDEDENLQHALSLSRQHMETEDEEADLRRAIHLSMQDGLNEGLLAIGERRDTFLSLRVDFTCLQIRKVLYKEQKIPKWPHPKIELQILQEQLQLNLLQWRSSEDGDKRTLRENNIYCLKIWFIPKNKVVLR
ncbi:ataxin-3 isoform X4 [Leucoraja erinacea]|uniref:ataxin-3 isoform X4 n=1 Tax=Leucoraja erinaceus TaxID=7782 RepID=UPI002456D3F6|nr:ataxin-3 isoform X4 [Leucoraja erinacea]